MKSKPQSATLFTFNVGFGDCFLLRFHYAGQMRRHVLVDFGSTRLPEHCPSNYLTRVAQQIKDLSGGELDIVVATHRHKDHIYGFRTNRNGTAPGDVIASCKPSLVLQPWTEHPDAPTDATASPDQRSFAKALLNMDRFSKAVYRIAREDAKRRLFDHETRAALSFLGENNIANKSAVKNLMTMGKKNLYLCFGQNAGTKAILPGVDVNVLGPPTLAQNTRIAKQRSRHEDEYWHMQQAAAAASLSEEDGAALFPGYGTAEIPEWARWGRKRLRKIRQDMLMPIVRQLDRQMNNTSLILLFSVGGKSLLFPGDAQWENWSHALDHPDVREKLKIVDLYKVGHHGSLNATPKTLWELFENRGGKTRPKRLISVMSTKHGVHGHSRETAVPRDTLVRALKSDTDFNTTEDLEIKPTSTRFYDEIELSLA